MYMIILHSCIHVHHYTTFLLPCTRRFTQQKLEGDKQRTLGFDAIEACKAALADKDVAGARAALDRAEVV